MPTIKEYNLGTEVQGAIEHRRAIGDEFGASVGKALESTGSQITQTTDVLQRRQAQAEVSDVTVQATNLKAEADQELQNRAQKGLTETGGGTSGDSSGATGTVGSTPADDNTDFTQKYMDDMGQKLDAMGENISTAEGQRHFNQLRATLQAHFLSSATSTQAELAGAKAKQNYVTSLNTLSSQLLTNPSSFDVNMKLHADALQAAQATGMDPKLAAALKTQGENQMAEAAIKGNIRNSQNPDDVRKQLDDGKWDQYIDANQKMKMYADVRQEQQGRLADAKMQQDNQAMAQGQAQMQTQNDFLAKLTKGALSKNDVLNSNLDAFGSGSKETFLKMMEAKADNKLKDDGNVVKDTLTRIMAPEGDPRKITNEQQIYNIGIQGGLSTTTMDWMAKHLQGGRTEAGKVTQEMQHNMLHAAEAAIAKKDAFGMQDPTGLDSYNRFFAMQAQKEQEYAQQGKDTRPLFDPNSKDYLGNQINTFVLSPQQRMQKQADMFRVKAAPVQQAQAPNQPAAQNYQTQAPAQPDLTPAKIAGMNLDDLNKIDRAKMTSEQKQAASARWNQIKGRK